MAAKKGTKMAAKWSPDTGAVPIQPFPLLRGCCSERPGAVKGAPLLGAAKRTLDGEHRSGIHPSFDGRRSGNTFLLVSLEPR